jgi:hypothetical protein
VCRLATATVDARLARRAVERLSTGTAHPLVQRELLAATGGTADAAVVDAIVASQDAIVGWAHGDAFVRSVLDRAVGWRTTVVHVDDDAHPLLRSSIHGRWLGLHQVVVPSEAVAGPVRRCVAGPISVIDVVHAAPGDAVTWSSVVPGYEALLQPLAVDDC